MYYFSKSADCILLQRVVFSETPLSISAEKNTSEIKESQNVSEPVKDAARRRLIGDDLIHVSLQQKLQLDSIMVNSASLSEESFLERSRQSDCKPVHR